MTKTLNAQPCPTCLETYRSGMMREEAVQPLPVGAQAPLGLDGRKQCFDCASAGTLIRMLGFTWEQARIAVANERQEQYCLPGVPMGLVGEGLVRPSKPGDLELHNRWRDKVLKTDGGVPCSNGSRPRAGSLF